MNNYIHVKFELDFCGEKTLKLDNRYEFDVTWSEIVSDVVRTIEAHYGYAFHLKDQNNKSIGSWTGDDD